MNEQMKKRRKGREKQQLSVPILEQLLIGDITDVVYPETTLQWESRGRTVFAKAQDQIWSLKLEPFFQNLPSPICFAMLGLMHAKHAPSHMPRPPTDTTNLELHPQITSVNIFTLNLWSLIMNNYIYLG